MASFPALNPNLWSITSIDSRPFNLRKRYIPAQIFLPKNTLEVAEIIREANKSDKKVAARCGGHSYASYGLGGRDGSWVIDLQKLDKIEVDHESNTARIGAGQRLGKVALELYAQGKKAIPHGLCPRVGIAGHSLHGGYGFTSRKWGLALDSIEELQVVLANGDIVFANKDQHAELFYALLGAGSSFGIVTEFKMRLQDAPEHCIHYWYTWKNRTKEGDALPPAEDLTQILMCFQEYAKKAPGELALRMRVLKNHMEVTGAYWGTMEEFKEAIAELEKLWRDNNVAPDDFKAAHDEGRQLGTTKAVARDWPKMLLYMANDDHLESRAIIEQLDSRAYADIALSGGIWPEIFSYLPQTPSNPFDSIGALSKALPEGAQAAPAISDPDFIELIKKSQTPLNDTFFATSLLVPEKISKDAADRLFKYIHETKPPAEHSWFLLIDTYGGEHSAIRNGANRSHSCYSFRDDMFTCQFYMYTDNHEPPFHDEGIEYLHSMRKAIVQEDPYKVYMCYVDPEDKSTAAHYYSDEVYQKLKACKNLHDPKYTLWNPQCVGAEDHAAKVETF